MNKISCFVANYDKDFDASEITNKIDCTVHVIDTSGKPKKNFISSQMPYYSGAYNTACDIFLKSDSEFIIVICSDIKGNIQAVIDKARSLNNDIGIYSPAVLGQGWDHEKPKFYGLRQVPFCEGMIFIANREIIKSVYPIQNSKHGFGVDIFQGYVAHQLGYKVVIDDDINVYHPFGTSYNFLEGQREMKGYVQSKGVDFWLSSNLDCVFGY